MLEWLLYGIILFFALYGIVQFIQMLKTTVLRPRKIYNSVYILPLKGHVGEIENIVRFTRNEIIASKEEHTMLVILDLGLDVECSAICDRLCKDLSGVCICKKDELSTVLEQNINLQIV